jgi:D-galactarolactone cycloisomerase
MKIADVRAHVLEAKLSQPFSYARAWYASRTALIVEIVTDEGLVGWGECYGPARINAAVVEAMRPLLVGQDAMRSEWLWQEIYARFRDHGQKGSIVQGLSGIDIALWDLKGKYLDEPVHRLMGGPLRTSVEAYATGLYRRETGAPENYLADEARGYRDAGFKAVKLKVGYGVDEDARMARAVRAGDRSRGRPDDRRQPRL